MTLQDIVLLLVFIALIVAGWYSLSHDEVDIEEQVFNGRQQRPKQPKI